MNEHNNDPENGSRREFSENCSDEGRLGKLLGKFENPFVILEF